LRKSKSISKIKDERSVSPVDSKTNQPMFKPKINKENPYYKNVAKNRDSTFIVRQLEIDEDEFKQVQTSRNSRGIKLHDLDESKSVDRSRSVKSTKNNTQSKNDANKSDHVVTFGGKNVKENVNPFFLHDITSNNESRDHNTSVGSVNIQKHPSLFENEQDKIILMKIFQCLDSNRDGRITAQDVDYSSLDAEVLEVIKDIIFSLEDDVVMTFEGFVKEIYENNLMIQLREMKELFQIGSNQQKEPFLMEEKVEKIVLNDSRKDELEDILFGRDSGVSKGSVITTADSSNFKEPERINTPTNQQKTPKSVVFADTLPNGLTKRYQALAEKSFSGKTGKTK